MVSRWTEADAKAFLKNPPPRGPRLRPMVRGHPCVDEVFLVLPYPPLNNRYYRHPQGRSMLSREARAYHRTVANIVLVEWPKSVLRPFNTPLVLSVTVRPPSPRHRPDSDGCFKAVMDSLEKAGVVTNDYLFTDLHLYRRPPAPPTGMLEVLIQPYKEA